MRIMSTAIINDEFEDKYGKWGRRFSPSGVPTYSVSFEISGALERTKSFVVVLKDRDTVAASSFVWMHQLIADLEYASVVENGSVSAKDYVQGADGWTSVLGKFEIEEASCYGGMTPPNCRHRYELIVYVLDTKLNLPRDPRFDDLHFAVQGHVLALASVTGTYDV